VSETSSGTGAMSRGPMADSGWGIILAFGIITALFGIAVMVWPDITIGVLVVLLGIQLVIAGVFDLVSAFTQVEGGMRWVVAIVGIIALGLGIFVIANIVDTVEALGVILGIFWIIHGIVDVISGLTNRASPNRGWKIGGGALAVVAGIVVISWPKKTLLLLAWIMGLWLLVLGVLMIAMAFAVKRAAQA
jgi:uncharacterized membrane protein HdeD (DUF308 family)